MNTRSSRQLRDPHHRLFHVPWGDHHQVGELIHHDQQVWVGSQHPLGSLGKFHLSGPDSLVEVVNVSEPESSQVVVAHIHLANHPGQGFRSFFRVCDDGGD